MRMTLRRMWLTMIMVTLAGASYAADPAPAPTNRLDTLRATCAAAADKIAADTLKQKDDALGQYGNSLDAILNDLKQKGDIDGYQVVQNETKRFKSDKTVLTNTPNVYVANAVAAYVKQVQAIETAAESRRADLLRQYIAALGRLIKDLMAQDKIEEAKAAGEVKNSAAISLAITEEKLPKAANVAKPSASVPPVSAEPRSESKDSGWKDITSDFEGGTKHGTTVVLGVRPSQRMQSQTSYCPPIEIEYVCKTEATDIRLVYACKQMIFNWECNQNELRLDGGPASGQHRPGAGKIPAKKSVTIRQVVLPDKMEVYVDGKLRTSWEADFSKVNSPIAVFNLGSEVTVKSIRVRVPQGSASESSSQQIVQSPALPPVPEKGHSVENTPKKVFFSNMEVTESPGYSFVTFDVRTSDKSLLPQLMYNVRYLCKTANTYKVVAMNKLRANPQNRAVCINSGLFVKYNDTSTSAYGKMPVSAYIEVTLEDEVIYTNVWHKQAGPKDWWVWDDEAGKYKGDSDTGSNMPKVKP